MSVAQAAESAPDRYFAALAATYASAAGENDEAAFELSIGRWRLQVSFASTELASMLVPPLERLLTPASGSGVAKIYVWDSASTRTPLPSFPWRATAVRAGGAVEGYDNGRFRTLYRDDGSGFHALSMFDLTDQIGLFWFSDHKRIHWYERAEPLRVGIHWALTTDRRYLAHASAVGDARGAIVLTGKGGAGKTTTTLSSIEAGLQFVGDNYVLLSLEREPTVYGLYGNAKLWPQTLELLPELIPFVRTFDVAFDEKLVVDVARYRPESIASGLPVRAVVVPEIVGSRATRLIRCSAVEALLALAPATLLQLPRNDSGLEGMAQLVRRVPCYKLELGEEVRSGPRALSHLLDELGS